MEGVYERRMKQMTEQTFFFILFFYMSCKKAYIHLFYAQFFDAITLWSDGRFAA